MTFQRARRAPAVARAVARSVTGAGRTSPSATLQSTDPAHAVRLVIPGNPVPKARPRWVRRSGRVYTPSTTTLAERRIVEYLKAAYPRLRPTSVRYGIVVRFYLSGVGRGDLDNYLKCLCDALNGRVWCDDKQVRKADVEMLDHCKSPRTEVFCYPLPDLGREVA